MTMTRATWLGATRAGGVPPATAQEPSAPPQGEKLLADAISWVSADPQAPADLQLKPDDRIVALGDSITAGGGYLRYVEQVLAAQYPGLGGLRIANAGISGNKAEDMIARFDRDVLQKNPTVVSINVGINDVWHRLKNPHDEAVLRKYRENLAAMVAKAQAAGARAILLAPTVIQEDPASEGNRRLPLYVAAMREVAAERKCAFVDLHALFLEALKHKPAGRPGNWLTGDGVHMQPTGNAVMALGLLRALGVPDAKSAATAIVRPPPRKPAPPREKPQGTNQPAAHAPPGAPA
jgi:lysophospholipase L1-like esterase